MIISKRKNLAKYILLFCLLSLTACYENVEGCLDIAALNYNAAADVDCEECCMFPQLQILTNTRVDTFDFSRNTKYVRDLIDTLIIHDIYIVLSEFLLQGENQEYQVRDMHAFAGTALERDDLVFEDFLNSEPVEIGTIIINDTISSLEIKIGLPASIDDKDNNFAQHAEIETLIDSMYYNATDNIEFFRLEFSHIRAQDTTQHSIQLSGQDEVFTETFAFETNINYGENIVISLDVDLLNLFDGIDFETQNTELIKQAILNNLRNHLFN